MVYIFLFLLQGNLNNKVARQGWFPSILSNLCVSCMYLVLTLYKYIGKQKLSNPQKFHYRNCLNYCVTCDIYYLVHKQLSAKKQLKAAAWHSKQKVKQKDNKDHEKSMQPCKYFQNGFCKSVSALKCIGGCF